jgi:hypothetical protein
MRVHLMLAQNPNESFQDRFPLEFPTTSRAIQGENP